MEKRKYLIILFLFVTTFFKIVNANNHSNVKGSHGDGTIVVLDDDLKVDHPETIVRVVILDQYGKEVMTLDGDNSNTFVHDISTLESKLYIVVAQTIDEEFSKQVYKN